MSSILRLYWLICFPNQIFARSWQIFKDDLNNFSSSSDICFMVRIARFCKRFSSQESTFPVYQAGRTDSLESIPGFLKRWQIRALELSRRLLLRFNVQHPIPRNRNAFITFFKSISEPKFSSNRFGRRIKNLERGILWTLCTE